MHDPHALSHGRDERPHWSWPSSRRGFFLFSGINLHGLLNPHLSQDSLAPVLSCPLLSCHLHSSLQGDQAWVMAKCTVLHFAIGERSHIPVSQLLLLLSITWQWECIINSLGKAMIVLMDIVALALSHGSGLFLQHSRLIGTEECCGEKNMHRCMRDCIPIHSLV